MPFNDRGRVSLYIRQNDLLRECRNFRHFQKGRYERYLHTSNFATLNHRRQCNLASALDMLYIAPISMGIVYSISKAWAAALLILVVGQCEGLRYGIGKQTIPRLFLRPLIYNFFLPYIGICRQPKSNNYEKVIFLSHANGCLPDVSDLMQIYLLSGLFSKR